MNSNQSLDLSSLVLAACQHPFGSLQRQRLLTEVICQMQRSGKISRNYHIPAEQYQEALQRTWIWFCQNIDRYDSTQASVMTWFNCTLKFRIKNVIHGEMVPTRLIAGLKRHNTKPLQAINYAGTTSDSAIYPP